MNKLIIFLVFLSSLSCFSQDTKAFADKILYENGKAVMEVLYDDDYFFERLNSDDLVLKKQTEETFNFICIKALVYFDELVTDYPESEYYLLALYEKAKLEDNLNNKKVAKETFLKIKNSGTTKWKWYVNKSLMYLAELSIEEKNYIEALTYLDLRKENGLNYFCGVERDVTEAQMKNMYEECYAALKDKK